MRKSLSILVVFALAVPSFADDAEAAAALALARARAAATTSAKAKPSKPPEKLAEVCHTNFAEARKKAQDEKRALVVWVGMQCNDAPDIRKAAKDAVHCHKDDWEGDTSRHLIVRTVNGDYYRLREPTAKTVEGLLQDKKSVAKPEKTPEKSKPPSTSYAPAPVYYAPVFAPARGAICST